MRHSLKKIIGYSPFIDTRDSESMVVIDPMFPQKIPFGFRNTEINEYFKRIDNFTSYTMPPMQPDEEAWFQHGYGMSYSEYLNNKKGYHNFYPENKAKIQYLKPGRRYKFKLAYTYFLAETYVLLPFLEKNKIPFVFVLYPGGGFGLNFNKSDHMLKKIFSSKYFQGVIVTQQITKEYLLNNNLCLKQRIHFIYGGFVQFSSDEVMDKQYYKKDKKTFDICFVAGKYSDKGLDKGYDLFVETAKDLARITDDIRFHVVGNFGQTDIDVSELNNKVTFYGFQDKSFFPKFYAGMDIVLSPNRPGKLFPGNFDGFPLCIDAAFCGSAMFLSDELRMNSEYTNEKDIVIIPLKTSDIVNKVMFYYHNPDKLYKLSEEGQILTERLMNIDHQIQERLRVFEKFMSLKRRTSFNER